MKAGGLPANSPLRRFESSAFGGAKAVGLGSGAQFRLNISAEFGEVIERAVTPESPGAELTAETYLFIDDVPKPTSGSTALRVFLNCKDPSLNTPLDDPTYVSTVAFFGADHDGHDATSFALNVTDTLSKVSKAGIYKPTSPVDVALVPVDLATVVIYPIAADGTRLPTVVRCSDRESTDQAGRQQCFQLIGLRGVSLQLFSKLTNSG